MKLKLTEWSGSAASLWVDWKVFEVEDLLHPKIIAVELNGARAIAMSETLDLIGFFDLSALSPDTGDEVGGILPPINGEFYSLEEAIRFNTEYPGATFEGDLVGGDSIDGIAEFIFYGWFATDGATIDNIALVVNLDLESCEITAKRMEIMYSPRTWG